MGYRYDLASLPQAAPTNTSATPKKTLARVVDVILDSDHPEYQLLGGPNAVGAIKYKPINSGISEESPEDLPVAYPLHSNIKIVPLKNEVVILESGPSESLSESNTSSKSYYSSIVSIWNHPHHNAYPDIKLNEGEYNLGKDVVEASDINPLQPYPGDVLFEGRQGQSIRFTGNFYKNNPFTTKENNGKPLIIISNGQKVTENGFDHIGEDVNEDSSSIYLTNSHKIPLEKLSFERKSYETAPISEESYAENQVALVSDRIILRSRTENTLISSNLSVGLLGRSINLDGGSSVDIESPRINLGKNATQPAVLGDSLVDLLENLIGELNSLGQALKISGQTLKSPELLGAGIKLSMTCEILENNFIGALTSTKTFIK